ncbi:MAG: glycosyltransferase family 2 protein [Synergistaceae bacterium]|nr:glycosyltransferase family 2 protein [Synergistaceae bacterium]
MNDMLNSTQHTAHSTNSLNDLKLLSVIIPAYNAEKYLEKCVDSVVNQTYKNIEIIIVDDGSNDSTPQICDELANKYNNIKVIHKENQGTSWARRDGVQAASGEYIAFIDSDDYIDLKAYEEVIKVLEENDLDMVQFGYYRVDTDGKIISEHKRDAVKFDNAHDAFKHFAFVIVRDITMLVDKVYKRELFENLEWPKDIAYAEDYCTDVQLFAKAQKFMAIEYTPYYYVNNLTSVTHRVVIDKSKILDLIKADIFTANFTEKNMPDCLPEILYYSINLHFCMIVLNISSDKPEIQELINQCIKMLEQDCKRMRDELELQGRKLYTVKKFPRKQSVIIWLIVHCPGLYKFYLKTRLKIHALTGI